MADFFKEYFDLKTFSITFILVIIGLASIYSATYDAGATTAFYKQLIFAGFGIVAFFIFAVLPLRTLQRISFAFYIGTLLLLLFVLVAGKTVSGSKSWLGFGGLGIQPSELAKVSTIMAVASYLARPMVDIKNTRHFYATIGLIFLPLILILGQPDLGTAIVFFAMLLPLLYWAGVSNSILLSILSPIIAGAGALFGTLWFLVAMVACGAVLYYTRENRFVAVLAFSAALAVGVSVQTVYERLPAYQQKRISTFMNPEKDRLGAGYNVEQSKVAIGSGGIFGKGYLKGTQTQLNFIPEQWTDFIFCVPAEEFGLAGAASILLLFAGLLLHGINLGAVCRSKFSSFTSIAITAVFTTHFMVNIGMALGIFPVIGIPLPFVSYGGSALLANMMMAGLLMNAYANRKEY